MSFTFKILTGLFLGVFTGLFLGEIASPFSVVGEIFIGLLQMTVLPYIVVSLISNLGGVSWVERRSTLVSGIAVLGFLLLLGVLVLIAAPLAFPVVKSASFFSSSLIEPARVFDLVELYIPANPFASLANNVVPAAVLFSILLGIGQISVTQACATLMGQESPPETRGSVVGTFSVCGAAGILFVTSVGGRLYDGIGPAAPFILIGVLNGVLGLCAVWIWRRR